MTFDHIGWIYDGSKAKIIAVHTGPGSVGRWRLNHGLNLGFAYFSFYTPDMATLSFKGTYQRLPGCNNTHRDEIIAQCRGPSSSLTFPPHFDISFSPAATTLHTPPSHPHLFPLYSNVCSWESRNKQIVELLSHHLSSCVIFITWHIHKLLHRLAMATITHAWVHLRLPRLWHLVKQDLETSNLCSFERVCIQIHPCLEVGGGVDGSFIHHSRLDVSRHHVKCKTWCWFQKTHLSYVSS